MNKNFWYKLLSNIKNFFIYFFIRILDFFKNKFFPFSKKYFAIVKINSVTASKKLFFLLKNFYSNKLSPLLNKVYSFFKKNTEILFKKILTLIINFYKNIFLPLSKKIIYLSKEYLSLITLDVKSDNKELIKKLIVSLSGLVFFANKAITKIKILYTRKKDLINYIKYLSYKRLILYLLVFVTFDIFLIWFSTYRILYAKHYWEGPQDKKFFIRPGKNLDDIIDDLKENDILKNKLIFKIFTKLSGKEYQIISRRYIFKNGICNSELLNLLTDKNMIQTEKFTIIEGLRIKQIAKIVENRLQLSQEKFIQETENDSLINILGLKGKIKNLEGFLFPDTYYLPLNVDEKELVNILFNEFRKKVLNNEVIINELKKSKKNLLEVITLASIIQGETNLVEEMGTISAVYHNRLNKKMKLEADPTIQYVLPDGPKQKLKYSDLKIDSPYNTYKYFGLPPGPINNPGLFAIKAAINPEKNNFLFFVATGNGGHKFSETYVEHLKAVEEYKKNIETKNGR